MNSFVIFNVLVHCLWCVGLCVGQGPSQCPDVLEYGYEGSNLVGYVIGNNPPYSDVVKIKVRYTVRTLLPNNNFGSVQLMSNNAEVQRAVAQNLSLRYKINFPAPSPLPSIISIVFNGATICSGPNRAGPGVTTVTVEHTLYPTANRVPSRPVFRPVEPDEYTWATDPPQPIPVYPVRPVRPVRPVKPVRPRTTTPAVIDFEDYDEPVVPESKPSSGTSPNDLQCGMPRAKLVSLVHGGASVERGDWPWLVALFHQERSRLQLKCGGTLIDNRRIITAAHCLLDKDKSTVESSVVILKVGAHNLIKYFEENTQIIGVSGMAVHGEYSAVTNTNDIAVLTMTSSVTFSQYIRPICMWEGDTDQRKVYNKRATVIGWGQTEDTTSSALPRMLSVPIVSSDTCKNSNQQFQQFTSNKTLCAGSKDERGPCKGDSGGGLYINQNGRWMLRGIVSSSLSGTEPGSCNLGEYIIYTDVAMYSDWVQQQI